MVGTKRKSCCKRAIFASSECKPILVWEVGPWLEARICHVGPFVRVNFVISHDKSSLAKQEYQHWCDFTGHLNPILILESQISILHRVTRSNIWLVLMSKLDANIAKDNCFSDKPIFAVESLYFSV